MNGDAKRDAIEARLEWLAKRGPLTPDAVIRDAKKQDSPLHGEFEWDDGKAGHRWRIEQARALIASVRLVIVNETRILSTVAYVRDPDADPKEQGYAKTADLQTDRMRGMAALRTEAGRAEAYLRRVLGLADALGMAEELEEIMNQWAVFRGVLTRQ